MKANGEFSRSLFVVEDMEKGDTITEENVRSIRPGFGLHPKYLNEILDKKVNKDLEKGTPIKLNYIYEWVYFYSSSISEIKISLASFNLLFFKFPS